VIPTTLIDTIALAYPSRRYDSPWVGTVVHSAQSVFIILLVLGLVLEKTQAQLASLIWQIA
jgi:hypothetical protein